MRRHPVLERKIEGFRKLLEALGNAVPPWRVKRKVALPRMVLPPVQHARWNENTTRAHLICDPVGVKIPAAEGDVFIIHFAVRRGEICAHPPWKKIKIKTKIPASLLTYGLEIPSTLEAHGSPIELHYAMLI